MVSIKSILAQYEIGAQIKLQATIAEQLFYNEETTYGVYRIEDVQSKKAACHVSGYFPYPVMPKTIYDIQGTVSLYKDEKQIKLESIYMTLPSTEDDIIVALQALNGINKQAHH